MNVCVQSIQHNSDSKYFKKYYIKSNLLISPNSWVSLNCFELLLGLHPTSPPLCFSSPHLFFLAAQY